MKLFQNYPNPFNPTTTIKFSIHQDLKVKLSVYNMLGEMVAELVNEKLSAGYYQVQFDGSKFASGIYMCKLESIEYNTVRKMILLR